MSPFDNAWALVKMPIVPHSLRQVGDGRHEARFIDPVSGEELPMTADNFYFRISDKEGNERASVPFELRDYDDYYDHDIIESEGSETEEPYRRRGYMTALYDMAARLAYDDKELATSYNNTGSGARIRQGRPEEGGMGDLLWEKIHQERGGDGYWPVRDDLYEVRE